MDFTLWALHNDGRMEMLDADLMREELLAHTAEHSPETHWAALLAGLCYRLDGCNDPQVQGAMKWVQQQMNAGTHQQPAPAAQQPDKYPAALLASFGVCSVVGAYTVIQWLWQLLNRLS